MRTKVCEACGNGIRIKRGYFVCVYEEPPEKHIYHLFCFKAKMVDERRRRMAEREEKKESGNLMEWYEMLDWDAIGQEGWSRLSPSIKKKVRESGSAPKFDAGENMDKIEEAKL